ncbi:MAG: phosphoglucosamine mutase [Chloroflexi bacterium]|nr:phosphoglucosamine mutase [Chloroflexota bacterium]
MTDQTAKLFGTDGIRGVANEWPLTPEFITRIGSAIGQALKGNGTRPLALIGRDTRLSGEMIENALAAGLMSQGFDTLHLGVLTTPGIAFLTHTRQARCGISISASHNPFEDNGIKVFGPDGFKIPDERENEIEKLAQSANNDKYAAESLGRRRDETQPLDAYADFLLGAVNRQPILQGQCVVVDCNNGATFDLAPRVLRELRAQVIALNDKPDGVNINRGYDSLEPKLLRETVLRERANWGVQFDGDGDRSVFVDERGNYIDGDFVLAILARDWAARGKLRTRAVISTVMANIGLERSLKEIGATLERTAVGDRWVTERMRESGTQIGGEQSGHIVLFDGGHTTGDGLYTAIRMAEVMARRNTSLAALAACMTRYPQVLINVRVPRKPPFEEFPQIQAQLEHAQSALSDSARILLRYSGTENLARVMIEGRDADAITREAQQIAKVIQETIK